MGQHQQTRNPAAGATGDPPARPNRMSESPQTAMNPPRPSVEATMVPTAALRRQAEAQALAHAARMPLALATMSPEEARRTLHELRVHQIQLEMQNEELRRTQVALRQSEVRYQRITEAITDYIYTVRVVAGRAVHAAHGPGCLAVTGYRDDEFAHDPQLWGRIVAEEDRPAVEEQARRMLAGGKPPPIEHRIIRKNAMERWVRNTFVPRYDEQGELVAYDGLIQDITVRRHAEEVRQASRDYLKTVLDSTTDAIYVADPESGRILDVNRSMCEMYGCSYTEALRTPPGGLNQGEPPNSQAEAVAWQEQARCCGPQSFEWLAKRKTGTLFWAEVSIRFTTLGAAERMVVTVRDISERKQAEEALKEKYTELERFNKVTVGREVRMIELKREINALLKAAGQPDKYRIFDEQE
jgi:PAS domain S-box-containing protein